MGWQGIEWVLPVYGIGIVVLPVVAFIVIWRRVKRGTLAKLRGFLPSKFERHRKRPVRFDLATPTRAVWPDGIRPIGPLVILVSWHKHRIVRGPVFSCDPAPT